MRRLRKILPHCAQATLALFVALVAVPRAAFVVHSHAGGGHEHVHLQATPTGDGEIDRLLAEALGEDATPHRHRPHDGSRPGLETSSAERLPSHWHAQAPFQQAVGVALPQLAVPTLVSAVPPAAARSSYAIPAQRAAARAPPAV